MREDGTRRELAEGERYGAGMVEEMEGMKAGREKITDEDLLRALEQLRALV